MYKYLLSPLPTLFCIVCCDQRESPPLDLAPPPRATRAAPHIPLLPYPTPHSSSLQVGPPPPGSRRGRSTRRRSSSRRRSSDVRRTPRFESDPTFDPVSDPASDPTPIDEAVWRKADRIVVDTKNRVGAKKGAPWRVYVGFAKGLDILVVQDPFWGRTAAEVKPRDAVGNLFVPDPDSPLNCAKRLASLMIELAKAGTLHITCAAPTHT